MFAFLTWNSSPIRVLLVEDSVCDAMLVREAFRESQVETEIVHVERLSKTLEQLAHANFDVVILDLGLPDSRGIDTLINVRRVAPEVPIVVLTGINDESLSMGSLEHGAQDYLVKNLMEGDLLVHSICHAIERHQLHKQLNQQLIQARQQQIENQKLESLAMLAGGIAHDFNELLTVIIRKAEMACQKATISPFVKETLEQIKSTGNQAAELCKQLLDYSGKGGRVLLLYDLSTVIEEMAPAFKQSLPHNITVEYQLIKPLPHVLADITQVRHLVMKLVQNAAEAIGRVQGIITISTSVVHADRKYLEKTLLGANLPESDYVCLEVTDTGCGMDSSIQTHAFEPFFSTKNSSRGLGLAAVHGIVRTCKGTMEIISEKGKGSTFSILFPCSVTGTAAHSVTKEAYEIKL